MILYEIVAIAVMIFVVMTFTGQLSITKMIADNEMLFRKLKEEDWDFYVRARYGEGVNPNVLFNKRIKNGFIVIAAALIIFISQLTAVIVVLAIVAGFLIFKMSHMQLKGFYKRNIHHIDEMLPHYLKNLEILIQHYTVPVAIGKSMETAPDIFKEGLQELINEINSGVGTIDPYMNFAKKYPVRDSMRMMRLLYRLSLGKQERKQEQLLTFSKSISSLQQKGRDTRYKNRLDKMEGKTMAMLISTGLGVMILLILSVLQMMNL